MAPIHHKKKQNARGDQERKFNNVLYTRNTLTSKENSLIVSERMKNITPFSENSEKSGITVLLTDNVNFKPRMIKRNKEGHYILVEGKLQEVVMAFINIYVPNMDVSSNVRQILIKRKNKISNSIIITGDYNTPLQTDRSTSQKIKNEKIQ